MTQDKHVEENDVKEPEDTTSQISEKKEGNAIPYSRFQEANQRRKEAEEKLKEYEAKEKQAETTRLEEEGKLQELLDNERKEKAELAKKAVQAEEAMTVISSSNEQMINELPEKLRPIAGSLKDKLNPTQFHEWLSTNRSTIKEMEAKPSLGSSVSTSPSESERMTLEQAKVLWASTSEADNKKADEAQRKGLIEGL